MSLTFSCHCIRCTNHRREHSQENESHKLIGFSKKGMYVGLKQPRGDGERYVTPARRAAAKETRRCRVVSDTASGWSYISLLILTFLNCSISAGAHSDLSQNYPD